MSINDFETILKGKYPAKKHAEKVIKLLKDKIPNAQGLLYLEGCKTRFLEDSDETEPFRQRRNFFYLTGCNLRDCHFIYDIQSSKSTLFIPPIDPDEVVWCGLPMTIETALETFDVDDVRYSTRILGDLSKIATNDSGFTIFTISDQISPQFQANIPIDKLDFTVLKDIIEKTRVVKDDFEIAMIRKANHISSLAHEEIMKQVRTAENEAELEAIFLERCVARKAKTMAYPSIFASGHACATLHYEANNAPLGGKLNLLVDAGCEWENYASDITRTIPLYGNFTKESRDIYAIVYQMQTECIKKLREGVNWDDIHLLAHEIAVNGLLRLGVLQGNREEILDGKISLAFFPHGLGHYLGLDTHDKGGNPNPEDENKYFRYLRTRGELPAGSVITVEPGIYFCRFIIEPYLKDAKQKQYINADVLDRYWDVGGIRLEDNVLVTATGCVNLTTAPKELLVVEKIAAN